MKQSQWETEFERLLAEYCAWQIEGESVEQRLRRREEFKLFIRNTHSQLLEQLKERIEKEKPPSLLNRSENLNEYKKGLDKALSIISEMQKEMEGK